MGTRNKNIEIHGVFEEVMKRLRPIIPIFWLIIMAFWLFVGSCMMRKVSKCKLGEARSIAVNVDSERISDGN